MNYFKQHIPSFCDGFTPFEFEFNSVEELLNHENIKQWKERGEFYRFSKSKNVLMCEFNDGKVWRVLGYIKNSDNLNLPEWEAKYS